MLRYAITNGARFGADQHALLQGLEADAARWARDGIDFVQLREKQLPVRERMRVAEAMMGALRGSRTKLLVNGRADVAVAVHAHGVHLTSHADELTPGQVRHVYASAGLYAPVVSLTCHTLEEVQRAREERADLIVFGPVFEKQADGRRVREGCGLDTLAQAVKAGAPLPVLALGGVTAANAEECIAAGACGIAGIRMFASV